MSENAARAGRTARQAAHSPALQRTARAGFAASGLVHLLIAYLALRVAWGGGGQEADQSGALAVLAGNPVGAVLLWLTALGCAALALWQVVDAVVDTRGGDGRGVRAAKSIATGAVYGVLAVSAARFALGSGRSSSSQTRGLTGRLLDNPGGRVLVVAVGLVVIAVGVYFGYKGVTRRFREDLRGNPGEGVERLGVVGHIAKGAALALVGLLFCLAGVRRSTAPAGGLDTALKALRDAPLGPYLLTAVGLGIAAYGVYMFARSRYARL
jgi:Domain of Unknown Function (DUF1206)